MVPTLRRRDFVKAAGAAGVTAAAGATGASGRPAPDATVSSGLRTETAEPLEATVVFDENGSVSLLDAFGPVTAVTDESLSGSEAVEFGSTDTVVGTSQTSF